jgi:hypothetical protein
MAVACLANLTHANPANGVRSIEKEHAVLGFALSGKNCANRPSRQNHFQASLWGLRVNLERDVL